jgi:hypothetical protein
MNWTKLGDRAGPIRTKLNWKCKGSGQSIRSLCLLGIHGAGRRPRSYDDVNTLRDGHDPEAGNKNLSIGITRRAQLASSCIPP